MVEVPSASEVSAKWKKRVDVSEPDYKKGIEKAKDWQGKTLARSGAFKDGVTAADIEDKFKAGVSDVPTEVWRKKTSDKAPRWKQGVGVSEPAFRDGITPVLNTIAGVDLGERGPPGSPENYDRVKKIGDALHAMKATK